MNETVIGIQILQNLINFGYGSLRVREIHFFAEGSASGDGNDDQEGGQVSYREAFE